MPIVVDRDERRAQVVAIAFDLVADRGIEALTFREIAAAAGCSTSIVSHYFGNKNELLFCIYQVANQRATERLLAARKSGASVKEALESVLPLSPESQRDWRVWLAFWARAHIDPTYFAERRQAAESSLALYREMLAESGTTNWNEEWLDLAARRLLAAVAGIGLEACFAPDDWTPNRIKAVFSAELAALSVNN
ncbi:TetR/AcrR family transcriptional regulator [Novosphingobium sp. SL115]|uniref:TetR/AcrR family transcriptional regulator n=1 Tax=Novosphingobium sp. SL115 TaxID=2995150 RepID=UPI002276D526|nr:TetR/AcrR family transcriptional regulator [Novosphingobium sp. SL115]MCY1670045.1 TetR/AcrR family transcriptional regulator [Novosphingobium sp. SL115]